MKNKLCVYFVDLNLSVCLSVTIFLVITGLSLVLVYDHFAVLTLIHNGSGNSCVLNVACNFQFLIAYGYHLVKCNRSSYGTSYS